MDVRAGGFVRDLERRRRIRSGCDESGFETGRGHSTHVGSPIAVCLVPATRLTPGLLSEPSRHAQRSSLQSINIDWSQFMYCPQCSQEQVTEEMRFCSRCGFPLAIVSQLVRGGGALEGFDPEAKGELSPRQKGVRWGLILMIVSLMLAPLAAVMTAMKSDFFVLFVPVLMLFVLGLGRLLHAYLLAQRTPTEIEKSLAANRAKRLPAARTSALPAGQYIPVTPWKQPVNTSEMAEPLSVTENTTRLLNDETDGESGSLN
jgi:hypothetical protein